jgi:hypothetical protein
MKRLLVNAVVLCLTTLPLSAGEPDDCMQDVLPDGPKDCVFRHVEYEAFSYANGELSLRWPKHYTLQEAYLAKDWKKMFAYQPGSRVQVDFAPNARYDVVARFMDRSTGESLLGITPISCVSRIADGPGLTLTPAPLAGCINDLSPQTCSVRTDVDCTDEQGNSTGTAVAECSGDTGSCSDECSDSRTACCTSTRTSSQTSSNGTQTSLTTIEQQEQGCED